MKIILRKHLVLLWLLLPVLAACTAGRPPQGNPSGTGTSNSSATPLPPAQAIDRGVLGKGSAKDMAWSPDGSLLVTNTDEGMEFWDVESGQLLGKIDITNGVPAFSADGRTLAISTFDGVIQYWGLPGIP